MSLENYATYREIKSQSEAWQNALEVGSIVSLPEAAGYEQVIFTGCGSTYYLALAAAALYQELTGCAARGVPAGELLFQPHTILTDQKTLLVALSRSGTTSETVKAVEMFKADKRGEIIAISNYGKALGPLADVSIVIEKGQEQSVAQTRSFASMYVAATALSARMAGHQDLAKAMNGLPDAGNSVINKYEGLAKDLGSNLDVDRFYFLGSGSRYGLACELNLKMKEMTLTHSEPFHFMEFRHGPMSMVNAKAVVVGMCSDVNRGHEKTVLNEIQALGGKTVALAESEAEIPFESQIPENARGVLYLPVLQLMAFYRSLAKGLNPDSPKNLTAVVQLKM